MGSVLELLYPPTHHKYVDLRQHRFLDKVYDFIWYLVLLLLYSSESFFTPVLPDVLPLEFEWHQVSSSVQDSSQYSGRS